MTHMLPFRKSILIATFAALLAPALLAQQNVPPAPKEGADVAAGPVFPKIDPADFTATSPTSDEVVAFLKASWGYDQSRVYQVQRISKTSVPGVASVLVVVGEKNNKQLSALQFFTMPDGKHIITGGEIVTFGAHPYDDNRATLLSRADGPSEGSVSKNLELVEFADFQCPHCKEAQPTMAKLVADFPNAHIVYQSFPLVRVHNQAFRASAYGVCVARIGGNADFFKFASAVYDGQAGLTTDDSTTLTLNSAVTAAGLSPDKIAACSTTPETKAAVQAQIKLAEDLGVNQTPSLAINGRIIPIGGVPYDMLKMIINYQAQMDGPAQTTR
uniref:Putative DSBA oxidoreductase n=1 Tax=mine drainage metagenome TaxID=410659 RepID=E6QIL8_9ZZZZ